MTVREDLEKLLDEKADKTLASTSADGLESREHYVKLDGVEAGATYDVVESTLANTANLVQNKVITSKLNSFDPLLRDLDTRITEAADKGGNPNTLKGMQTLLGRLQADKNVLVKAIDDIRGAHSCADHWVEAPP